MVRGGFPELYEKPELDARGFYQSYVVTYLERDLRSQLQVGSLRDFERFLRAAALRTAGLLNRAELAHDVGISPLTAGQWLSVLERSGIVTLLEPWFSNPTKSLVKTPKLHFRDTGLCAFLMGIVSRGDLMDSPLAGGLWESMVCGELQRLVNSALSLGSSRFGGTAPRRPTSSCTAPAAFAWPTPSGTSIPRDRASWPWYVESWTQSLRVPSFVARQTATRSRRVSRPSLWPIFRPSSEIHSRELGDNVLRFCPLPLVDKRRRRRQVL